jgi:hypothetical protein
MKKHGIYPTTCDILAANVVTNKETNVVYNKSRNNKHHWEIQYRAVPYMRSNT